MIEKVANNILNTEQLNLNPSLLVREKLDFFRSLFGKVHDLPSEAFNMLKKDIATFFNLKPVHLAVKAPERIVRISFNNKILHSQNKALGLLTEISQLLAPPLNYCRYGRCNLLKQQVLYCAMDEASAYWETKPQKGDVITLSHFKLKEDAKVNCSVITNKEDQRELTNDLIQTYYYLDDFFIDAYSFGVDRDRPRDYIFSAMLSSEQLFQPVASPDNIEAIIYPSVQKKMQGVNIAIRNDLVLEKYDLIAVETRFILEEYDEVDPYSVDLTTDDLIGSIASYTFDLNEGKILYSERANEIFDLFRQLQTGSKKQIRFDNPKKVKRVPFNLSFEKNNVVSSDPPPGENYTIGMIGA